MPPVTQGDPQSPVPTFDEGPMSHWIVATDLDELHSTWTAFACQSAMADATANALVPYADAVAHVGESWGFAEGPPALILIDQEGHAYQYASGRHGLDPATESRESVDPTRLQSEGWKALVAGKPMHLEYRGSALQVMGALRGTGSCGECHQDRGAALLGAYVYTLHEIADD